MVLHGHAAVDGSGGDDAHQVDGADDGGDAGGDEEDAHAIARQSSDRRPRRGRRATTVTRTIMSVAQRWLVRGAWISCCRLVSSGFASVSQNQLFDGGQPAGAHTGARAKPGGQATRFAGRAGYGCGRTGRCRGWRQCREKDGPVRPWRCALAAASGAAGAMGLRLRQ